MSPRLRLASLLAPFAVAALAGSGCGSSATGTSIDPANAVPASAAVYVGAVVRPEGSLQKAASTAGRKLTHREDPYLQLLGALQTPGSGSLDYKRDVAPWLGPRAGVFLRSGASSSEAAISRLLSLVQQALLGGASGGGSFPFAAHAAEGAFVLDTRDTAKARSFLQTLAKRAGAQTKSYRGISYQVGGGIAFAIVSRLAVLGTEPAVHEVIDTTSAGGLSLAHSPGYAKLQAAAPAGVLAHLYANPGAVSEGSLRSHAQGSAAALALIAGQRLLNVSLVPSSTSIALDVDAVGPESGSAASGGLLAASPQASQALGELPGESWLAVGLGDLGTTLSANAQALQGLSSLGSLIAGPSAAAPSAGLSVTGIVEGLLKPLTVLGANTAETKRDFASWMGSAGLFASGSGLLELRGGIVIDSKNPALSRAAVGKLGAMLRRTGSAVESASIAGTDAAVEVHLSGLPVVLDIANGRDGAGHTKFVIGIGEQSVETALNPSSTLSGASSYGAASAALGEGIQPSVLVEFPTLLGLLEGVGLSEDPTVAPFVPYLRSVGTLAGGGKTLDGGIERFRLVLGLQGGA
jgi:Protein of unknown function (DUF3352)